jgi:hypothetical protein
VWRQAGSAGDIDGSLARMTPVESASAELVCQIVVRIDV